MYFDDAPGPVFRPPSEAHSLILRITIGCSHNQCSFCSMYKGVVFRKRDLSEIFSLIERAYQDEPMTRRIFLADGNSLCLDTEDLVQILDKLKQTFPRLQRVTSYGAPQDILNKSDEDLALLKEKGLQMIYLGLETGSDLILKKIRKGVTAEEMVTCAQKIKKAGMKLSVMIILGLGGFEYSSNHILDTASIASQMSPTYLSALSLMIHPGTELRREAETGKFIPLSPYQTLGELVTLLENISPTSPIIFRSSHPSNFTVLAGTLPKDQERLIQEAKVSMKLLEKHQTPDFNDHGRF